MNNLDLSPAVPLTEAERLHYQSEAAKGKIPTLEICRRFIATIRKDAPKLTLSAETTKKSRTKAPPPDESTVDFF